MKTTTAIIKKIYLTLYYWCPYCNEFNWDILETNKGEKKIKCNICKKEYIFNWNVKEE
jgi:transcription elongation factor Elf1